MASDKEKNTTRAVPVRPHTSTGGAGTAAVPKRPTAVQTPDEPQTNEYYITVSGRYRKAKFITILLLVLFFFVVGTVWHDQITYSNLMYLLRDFNTGEAEYTGGFDPISYDEQENMSFAVYREELAVAGNRSVRFYNTKGTLSREYTPGYADPVLLSSDKYMIAFDLGDESYSVYNSVANTHSGEAEGAVEDAALNDSGEYVLLCRSDETKYVAYAYDSSFRLQAKYYKNKYVMSVDISDSGDVLLVSVTPGTEDLVADAEIYGKGEERARVSISLGGAFPLEAGFTDGGGIYVVCTDRVLFFDKNGNSLSQFNSDRPISAMTADESRVVISFAGDVIGSNSLIFMFDISGELLYNGKVDGNVTSVALSENELFLLTEKSVLVIPYEGGEIAIVPSQEGEVLISTAGTAVLCGKTTAGSVIPDLSDTPAVSDEN